MSAASADLTAARGLKRACAGCGIRFYDLNKRPITCPNCAAEFTGEIKLKTRRGRAAAVAEAPVAAPANDRFEEVEATENTISLEEVEETNAGEEEDVELEGGDLESLEEIEEDLEADDLEIKVEKE